MERRASRDSNTNPTPEDGQKGGYWLNSGLSDFEAASGLFWFETRIVARDALFGPYLIEKDGRAQMIPFHVQRQVKVPMVSCVAFSSRVIRTRRSPFSVTAPAARPVRAAAPSNTSPQARERQRGGASLRFLEAGIVGRDALRRSLSFNSWRQFA